MNFAQIEALWNLDLIGASDLQKSAMQALESGCAEKMLYDLAFALDEKDAVDIFEKWCARDGSLGIHDSLREYAKLISSLIEKEEILPEIGAKRIWEASLKSKDEDFHDLDPFIYAISELESRPEDREFFRNEIRAEAKRWLKS